MGVDHPQFGTFCEICFEQLTPETCAVDVDGAKWDICPGECARQAGIQTYTACAVCGMRFTDVADELRHLDRDHGLTNQATIPDKEPPF